MYCALCKNEFSYKDLSWFRRLRLAIDGITGSSPCFEKWARKGFDYERIVSIADRCLYNVFTAAPPDRNEELHAIIDILNEWETSMNDTSLACASIVRSAIKEAFGFATKDLGRLMTNWYTWIIEVRGVADTSLRVPFLAPNAEAAYNWLLEALLKRDDADTCLQWSLGRVYCEVKDGEWLEFTNDFWSHYAGGITTPEASGIVNRK